MKGFKIILTFILQMYYTNRVIFTYFNATWTVPVVCVGYENVGNSVFPDLFVRYHIFFCSILTKKGGKYLGLCRGKEIWRMPYRFLP